MTKPDIFTVQARIRPFSREKKLAHLANLIKVEKKRSFRRAELEALAKRIRFDALVDWNKSQHPAKQDRA